MRYTEQQLSSDLLDQRFHEGVPRKLLILAPPRTGSYMLCRMLLNAGIGVPHEYFNEMHVRVIGARFRVAGTDDLFRLQNDPAILQRYLRLLYAFRTHDGLFAAKIQYKQLHLFLRGDFGRSLFEGAAFVYLTRQDVLAQAVSWHFAELTGQWSFEPHLLTPPQQKPEFFDFAAIDKIVMTIRLEQALWESFFLRHQIKPLRATYEGLARAPGRIVSEIATLAGATTNSAGFGYDDEGPYITSPSQPTKAAVITYCRHIQAERDARLRPANAAGTALHGVERFPEHRVPRPGRSRA